jgi:hypothetical protein
MNCRGCPFSGTDEAEQIQNWGCLPSNSDIVEMYEKKEEVWMCHSNSDRICQGLKERIGDSFSAENKRIRTAEHF